MKDLLIFMAAYLGLSIVYAIMFIGIVFISLFTLKVLFNMNEDKWNAFFQYKNGQRIYTILIIVYIISISLVFLLGLAWFRWINYNNPILSALIIAGIILIMGLIKFSKIKQLMENKYKSYFN